MMDLRLTLISISVAAALFALAPFHAHGAEKAGDVVSLRGTAVIERHARKIAAEPKAQLLEADSVATMKRSRIKMLFRDDSVLTLGSASRLVIRQYLLSPENKRADSIYELADGRLRAVVGSAGFKVTTPTAFAAARGTVFITWYDSVKDSTGVAVIEGSVSVQNRNEAVRGTVVLKAGQMAFVLRNRPPGQPAPFNLKADIERDTERGEVFSDVTGAGPPDLAVPPPPQPAISDVHALVRTIPAAPPIAQTQGIAVTGVTRVNLNLQFP